MNKLIIPIFLLLFLGVFFLILDSRHGYLKRLNEKLSQGPKGQVWNKAVKTIRLISGLYAACLFLVVSVVNICTWFSQDIGRYAHSLMWLHLFVLAAFFICIGFSQQQRRPGDKKNYLRVMPKWASTVGKILFIYFFASFVLQMVHSHGGYHISERDGKHFIEFNGQTEREMSPEEYWEKESQELRGFSGLWMFFSFYAAAFLLLGKVQPSQENQQNLPVLQ